MFRALEYYRDSGGIPLSEALKKQHAESGFSYRGSFRFRRCCLLWLTCKKEGTVIERGVRDHPSLDVLERVELERRIDDRIQSMINRGLVDELSKFHDEFKRTQSESEKSFDYTRGIFQAIGFKEFHEYLLLPDDERKNDQGKIVFQNGR